PLLGSRQEPCPDRGRHIRAHTDLTSSAARSRREGNIRSTRDSSATVVFFWRSESCSASIATSGPTRRSKRKQSTTVRAGLVIRAATPSNAVSLTPYVHAAPVNRTMRSLSDIDRGALAL